MSIFHGIRETSNLVFKAGQKKHLFFGKIGLKGGAWGGIVAGFNEWNQGGSTTDVFQAVGVGSVSSGFGSVVGMYIGTGLGGPIGTIAGYTLGIGISKASYYLIDYGIDYYRRKR